MSNGSSEVRARLTRKRQPVAVRAQETARTLPMFETSPDTDARARYPARQEPTTEDLVLEVYWSAAVHAHALASAASRSPSPRERWALRRLVELEEESKERASQFLRQLWGVQLAA